MTAARVAASIEFARGEIHLRLDLPDVPFVALTGPNGAGKTSALRCLAGLEQAAHVEWPDGEPASRGYLPQRVMLYPAMSLADNIASSMRFAGLNKANITERTAELLDLVDIAALARRRPHEVSGGQRQRTGLARAIAATPKLLLLDEPFSAIDVASRVRVRTRIVKHIAESGASCVIATHDPNDLEATDAASIVLS